VYRVGFVQHGKLDTHRLHRHIPNTVGGLLLTLFRQWMEALG